MLATALEPHKEPPQTSLCRRCRAAHALANLLQANDFDKVSSAYANALVELAQEKNALDTVHADVDSLQARTWCLP